MIDPRCTETKALFSEKEWVEVESASSLPLPGLPELIGTYVDTLKQATIARENLTTIPIPNINQLTMNLALLTVHKW
jgi:hypothetical protein